MAVQETTLEITVGFDAVLTSKENVAESLTGLLDRINQDSWTLLNMHILSLTPFSIVKKSEAQRMKALEFLCLSAVHLLKAAMGPEDGSTSWSQIHKTWLGKAEALLKKES